MMGTMARTPLRLFSVLCLSLLGGLGHAQDNEPYVDDPPERAARLSFISGDVSLQPAGETDWTAALVNRPLTTGDKLWTEQNARAEIYVGPAAVRLDDNTGFSFLNVDDDTIQMRVTAGVMNVSVRTLDGGEHIEIATPNVALTLLRAGNYRVEVNDAGDATVVKVSLGSVQATGGAQDTVVYANQVATFTGTDDVIAQYGTLGPQDDFDSWSLERDRRDELAANSRTTEYVSPEVTGYQDLEQHGSWSSEPGYGNVWAPTYVNVGWAPYRYGRWVSISPWGWTWIDDAPWGYAPFHYGRWAHIRHRWCWVPGPRHVRPVYAPALVGWGPSPRGHVSWFPLGPGEAYTPGYRYGRRYIERVNNSNTVITRAVARDLNGNRAANTTFRNRVVDGVTAATQSQFTSAGRLGPQRIRLSEQDLATGTANSLAPRIAASRQSRLGGPVRTNTRIPPQAVANRQVVVRRDPPPSAAQFARRAVEHGEVAARTPERNNAPERNNHPRERAAGGSQVQQAPTGNGLANTMRERMDRPPRVDRPAGESAPPARTSVFDREALSGRVREDRDRQVREVQQQRDDAIREGWQRQDQARQEQARAQQDRVQQDRPPREQTQRSRDLEQQLRNQVQRQQETRPSTQRQQVERPQVERQRYEQPRVEQPRYEQRREQPRHEQPQPRVEQPRVQQPRAEQPRSQPPRAEAPREQTHRSENRGSETRAPSESRSPSNSRNDGSRKNRN